MKRRLIIKISIICLVLIGIVSLVGCSGIYYNNPPYWPEYESGYFRYALYTSEDGKERSAYLIGLTESGLQQEALIYPNEIDGITVYGISYDIQTNNISAWAPSETVGSLESPNLKKLFFLDNPETRSGLTLNYPSGISIVYWNLEEKLNMTIYSPLITTQSYYKEYNNGIYKNVIIANVMYMYNYEESPNEGCYWVDSYDEGLITFIPPMPEREGYYFAGWYKEPECINKWDFDVDKTGKEIVEDTSNYEGIYLYARWIEM